jgi:hypothetical protein
MVDSIIRIHADKRLPGGKELLAGLSYGTRKALFSEEMTSARLTVYLSKYTRSR